MRFDLILKSFFGLIIHIELVPTIMVIIFRDFLMFGHIFLSQMKRSVIISNKHGIYELPLELPNDLKLKILGNHGNLKTS